LVNVSTEDVKPDPFYLRWQANPKTTGWLFYILTPYNTKADIEAMIPPAFISDFHVQLKQPQLLPPADIHFITHTDVMEYIMIGWLLFPRLASAKVH
jgi:hypothetical protein